MPSHSPSHRHSSDSCHSRAGGNPPSPTASQIRQQFIDFFVLKHAHTFYPSSPVVPHDDPTLLFTNAGMNQYKPIFLGQTDPNSALATLTRAANSQKCIRAGGKHNDLDDVGKDLYHHTFFEMLGNWSFGDYFKQEAIDWAWQLLVDHWGLDPSRLYATYFEGNPDQQLEPDAEARDLWLKLLPADHVLPGDMKDNFWEMGDTGPCGPCSELHYDGRPDDQRQSTPGHTLVNKDHADVIEIWNLVFIQFDRQPGSLKPLPAQHVDTGMGLERIARVLQGVNSNYDTDLFTTLFDAIQKITGADPYTGKLDDLKDTAYRVIADHIRTLTFAIADGATPSNDGRGYVLRSILRRAVFYGRFHLNASDGFLHKLVPTVTQILGDFFPEITKQQKHVANIIADEESSFGKTIANGYRQFGHALGIMLGNEVERNINIEFAGVTSGYWETDKIQPDMSIGLTFIDKEEPRKVHTVRMNVDKPLELATKFGITISEIPKHAAFKLHDTYGFPIGLTKLMAEERGLTVDEEGFERLMEEARAKSRAGGKTNADDPVRTIGAEHVADLQNRGVKNTQNSAVFDQNDHKSTVSALWIGTQFVDSATDGAHAALICESSNFYAQMGGQVGDTGTITTNGATFEVEDTLSCAGYVLHVGTIIRGTFEVGDDVTLERNAPRRNAIERNHTATHLLNHALRDILGANVNQKGSLVAPDRLRFDFSHNSPLTHPELVRTNEHISEVVQQDVPVYAQSAPLDSARTIAGLRAVFGETYPDPVRIVSVGVPISDLLSDPSCDTWMQHSIEFCGGTHVATTGKIQQTALIEEEAVAKGVRRIVMLTGHAAREAIECGQQLTARTQKASQLDAEALADEVPAILSELEHRTVPLADAHEVRRLFDSLREKIKAAKKESAKAGRGEAVDAARELAESAAGDVIVGQIPAGGDRQALLAAMDCVRARHEGAAIMLASVDDESGKVALVASCSKDAIAKGLKAGDWVREVSAVLGGKGGGRPDSAQGGGTDIAKLDDAFTLASEFAQEKLN